jgi:hypothetical protein
MDFGVAIIGIITIIICIVPVYLLVRSGQKRKNSMLASLRNSAAAHNCELSSYEFCNDFVIGIDLSRKFVFFHKKSDRTDISQFVDLNTVLSCQAIKQSSAVQSEAGQMTVFEKLELAFTPRDKGSAESRFGLYDVSHNFHLSGELQLMDKWVKIINDQLPQR